MFTESEVELRRLRDQGSPSPIVGLRALEFDYNN